MDTVSEKTQHITSAVTLLRDAIRNDNLHQLPEVYQRILAASQGVASVFPEVWVLISSKFYKALVPILLSPLEFDV